MRMRISSGDAARSQPAQVIHGIRPRRLALAAVKSGAFLERSALRRAQPSAVRRSPVGTAMARPAPRPVSRLRGADTGRTGVDLDRAGRFELLAIEIEGLELLLDHALDQRCVSLLQAAPWHQWPTLASVSGANFLPLTQRTFTRP